MFDIGFPELVLIFVIGLLVLGPQRLPKVAAEIGKWVGRARRTATQLRRQLEREIELSELETPSPPPSSNSIRPPASQPQSAAVKPVDPVAPPSPAPSEAPEPSEPAATQSAEDAAATGAVAPRERFGTGDQQP